MMKINKFFLIAGYWLLIIGAANAAEFSGEDYTLNLSANAATGLIPVPDDRRDVYSDFRVRADGKYNIAGDYYLGAAYSYDWTVWNSHKFARDAFLFAESGAGRIEAGVTDSVARKLGLELPDVGLRFSNSAGLFRVLGSHNTLNATTGDSVRFAYRANIVSAPGKWQYGVSAGAGYGFDSAFDAAVKYKQSAGAVKSSVSLGASLVNSPIGEDADGFVADEFADWRATVALAANIQYNSWQFGAFARGIYNKNPDAPSDGFNAGAGASYDLLNWSWSLSYVLSDIGAWGGENIITHAAAFGARYKFNDSMDAFLSAGGQIQESKTSPFVIFGIRGKI